MTNGIHKGADGGTVFVGPNAISVFRAVVLRSALRLLKDGIVPRRGLSSKRALAMASQYTGKAYKRGQNALAMVDLQAWIEEHQR